MSQHSCLNCGALLEKKYCASCGQKADTHRITLHHFIFHDLLHGVFHVDKGMLFTAKEAIIRPGTAALDYISGKRINYYNVFYFILLLIGANILIRHFHKSLLSEHFPSNIEVLTTNENSKKLTDFINNNMKLIIFSFVPLTALNSWILFRKKRLNYPEHVILSGMILLALTLFTTIANIIDFVVFLGIPLVFKDTISSVTQLVSLGFIVFAYYNAFGKDFKHISFIIRMLIFFLLIIFQILILTLIILFIINDNSLADISM